MLYGKKILKIEFYLCVGVFVIVIIILIVMCYVCIFGIKNNLILYIGHNYYLGYQI